MSPHRKPNNSTGDLTTRRSARLHHGRQRSRYPEAAQYGKDRIFPLELLRNFLPFESRRFLRKFEYTLIPEQDYILIESTFADGPKKVTTYDLQDDKRDMSDPLLQALGEMSHFVAEHITGSIFRLEAEYTDGEFAETFVDYELRTYLKSEIE